MPPTEGREVRLRPGGGGDPRPQRRAADGSLPLAFTVQELYLPAAPKSKEQGTCAYGTGPSGDVGLVGCPGGIQSVEGVASVVLSITDELPAKAPA